MSNQHPTSRELHAAHADERNRIHRLHRHEAEVRERERARILAHLGVSTQPEPADPDVFYEGCTI